MILHNCIKCDNFELIPIADKLPCFEKYVCPICGEEQWIYHSRVEPKTYSKNQIKILPNWDVEIRGDK